MSEWTPDPADFLSQEEMLEFELKWIIRDDLPKDEEFYKNNENELVFDLAKLGYIYFPIVINKIMEWQSENDINNLKIFCRCLVPSRPRGRPRKVNPITIAREYSIEIGFWKKISEEFKKYKRKSTIFKALNEIKKKYPKSIQEKIDKFYNDIPYEASIASLAEKHNCSEDTIKTNLSKGRKYLNSKKEGKK